jgi:hypothetical protein
VDLLLQRNERSFVTAVPHFPFSETFAVDSVTLVAGRLTELAEGEAG